MLYEKDKIKEIIDNALKNVQELVNVDTVVGTPVKGENGDCIIPVSQVTFGTVSGGGEYGKLSLFKNNDYPHSAGNGTVVSLKPCGFLIKTADNDYKIVPFGLTGYDALIGKVIEFLDKTVKGK